MRMGLPPITPMVKRLMQINAAVFVLYFIIWYVSTPAADGVVRWFGLDPGLWAAQAPFVPVWQLISYSFLHAASDPTHIMFNMLLLYFFGTMLETILGSNRFLMVFVGAALCGGLFHLVGEWLFGAGLPVIGASGAVLGVLVATAVLRPDTQVLFFFFPVRLRWLATGIVVLDALNLLIGLKGGSAGLVAHHVHLGGALYGFLAARGGWVRWDPIGRLRQRQIDGQQNRKQADQERLDALLKKIHSEGLGSLSDKERDFLKRVSRKG